jgi:hypothetical protein
MVLTSPGEPITHIYRSSFPRSSDVVHLRATKALGAADAGAGSVVILIRPRGYFGLPRDVVPLDGKEPADVKRGVSTDSAATLRLPAGEVGRPVLTMFNQERIAARAWPASENRVVIAELTYWPVAAESAFEVPTERTYIGVDLARHHEHSRNLRPAGQARPSGAAKPAARSRQHDGFRPHANDARQPDPDLGQSRL